MLACAEAGYAIDVAVVDFCCSGRESAGYAGMAVGCGDGWGGCVDRRDCDAVPGDYGDDLEPRLAIDGKGDCAAAV